MRLMKTLDENGIPEIPLEHFRIKRHFNGYQEGEIIPVDSDDLWLWELRCGWGGAEYIVEDYNPDGGGTEWDEGVLVKRCSRCGQVLPIIAFYKSLKSITQHTSACKSCLIQRERELKDEKANLNVYQ